MATAPVPGNSAQVPGTAVGDLSGGEAPKPPSKVGKLRRASGFFSLIQPFLTAIGLAAGVLIFYFHDRESIKESLLVAQKAEVAKLEARVAVLEKYLSNYSRIALAQSRWMCDKRGTGGTWDPNQKTCSFNDGNVERYNFFELP